MDGYLGRILCVDLSSEELRDEPLDPEFVRDYMGGSGLAAAFLAREDIAAIDPLGPGNPLVWMTGPLVGTAMPSAGRISVCAISPLTGIWGEANTGGSLGPRLRFAGYDGIVVTGRAERPVWLSIIDGTATLHEADELRGLDTYATQDSVRERLASNQVSVACIGEAGERGVRYASIMNDHGRAAGRCGLGAVMGSKNLKALAVAGRAEVPVADSKTLSDVVKAVLQHTEEDIAAQAIWMAGTPGCLDMALMYGDLPIRSFGQGERAEAGNLSGVRLT